MTERGGEGFLTHAAEGRLLAENLSLRQQLEGEECAGRVASQQIESLVQQLEEAKGERDFSEQQRQRNLESVVRLDAEREKAEQQLERLKTAIREHRAAPPNRHLAARDEALWAALAELEKGET